MKQTLEALIRDATQELFGVEAPGFVVEHPELSHGDWTTNAALVVAKAAGKNPREVADMLVDVLQKNKPDDVEAISVAGPGFINISLSPQYFSTVIKDAMHGESWGKNHLFADKKILVEHSSPNLFKAFHVGHVMNNSIGESIVRLAKYSGAEVIAMSYPSDVGLGIGKAIWALMLDGEEKLEELQTPAEKLAYLGECYVNGTRAYDEDEKVQAEVRAITKELYEKTPGPVLSAYEIGKKINLEYFLGIVARLGSVFDDFIYESEAGELGQKIVREHIPTIFEESEGAVVYKGEKDGFHTRVFINKDGYPTYEAKDIGLLSLKFGRYDPDTSILITDSQQSSYYEVVLSAAGKIDPKWQKQTVHRTHGRMSFKGQKMSSRLGGVPTAQAVLDAIAAEVADRSSELSAGAKEAIAIASLKFVILRAMAGKDINFDPDTSLSFEGDSGPYLQYAVVRAGSILSKAKDLGLTPSIDATSVPTNVERLIARFPDIVARATVDWAPHHVVGYLLELAQAFNSWYGNTKIIDDADMAGTPHRLAVTLAVERTITNGLWLLGISVPEKM